MDRKTFRILGSILLGSLLGTHVRSQGIPAIQPPPGHDFPSCSASSEQPLTTFDIRNIKYHRENSFQSAQLVFDLRNSANNQTSHCNMTSNAFTPNPSATDNYGVPCDNGDVMKIPEAYTINTLVHFNRTSTLLTVNQTWYCDEVNPEYPIAFLGKSETLIQNFTCTSTALTEDCTAPNFNVYLWVYDRVDLPPYALEGGSPRTNSSSRSA